MENSVESLLKTPFSRRQLAEKIKIKQLGRPTPDLNLKQTAVSNKSTYTRKFNRKVYDHDWVCGCEIRNALFCFPCLLFGNSDAWSTVGFTDLGHLNGLMKKHSENVKHMHNVLDLSALGSVNIATQISRAYHEEMEKHNKQVERNRYVLSRIIDCIKFCGGFELALRGHDESDTSKNPGIFLGLVDLISSVDSAVKQHMESNHIFKGTSKTVQNELLDCMLETCRQLIMEEMKLAEFVAIMADETTDISEQTQLALVFRYHINGAPYERFWVFFNPDGQNADAISKCILSEVDAIFKDKPHKIIAQTYDGANVMSGAMGGVQAKIKLHYPNAHYIHCYAHQLNLTMQKAASQNQSARVFFLNLSAVPAFFSKSPQRVTALQTVAARRIPCAPQTRWNFRSRTVNTVYENKDSLIECFLNLEKSTSNATCQEANGLRRSLEDKDFLFWLSFFHQLMPHVDMLYDQLQARSVDAVKAKSNVTHFVQAINHIRDSVDSIDIEVTSENKRRKLACRRADAKEVCDRITQEARDRFQTLDHLQAAKLFNSCKFQEYTRVFPEAELCATTEAYSMVEKKRLKTELSVLYQRRDFGNIEGAVPLLQFILKSNLQSTFSEVTKLLKILVTIPMTTSEPERCFSSLKRIKTFLRNTMLQERLSALAMLSIEKSYVSSIDGFNSRVIDKFCSKKNRRMDFVFRH